MVARTTMCALAQQPHEVVEHGATTKRPLVEVVFVRGDFGIAKHLGVGGTPVFQ